MRWVLASVLVARVAHAECDVEQLDRWHQSWALTYGALTLGQGALIAARTNPLGEYDRKFRWTLYVGAAESAIGFLASAAAPAITCKDAAKAERTLFWGSHVGNLVVNAAGSLVLAHEADWSAAGVSFVLGYAIGLLNTYTMPRSAWHLAAHGTALGVARSF